MLKFIFYVLIFSNTIFIFSNKVNSSPIGKGLSCKPVDQINFSNFDVFRGLFFESNKSVRVVSFKSKNSSLKIISNVDSLLFGGDNNCCWYCIIFGIVID